jgi:hypothetical protein
LDSPAGSEQNSWMSHGGRKEVPVFRLLFDSELLLFVMGTFDGFGGKTWTVPDDFKYVRRRTEHRSLLL